MSPTSRLSASILAILYPALSTSPALAQDAPRATAALEEIVVTAQRREERLREVPVSVTAITAGDIAAQSVSSLGDIQASVPGLRMVDIGPGSQRIQLRGISQYQGLPTVGNYIDEFSINNYGASGTAEVRLLDIERIEVLRGPQPALYGEGSMGGTIRYVTATPRLGEAFGNALIETSETKDGELGVKAEGALNAPLGETVALRFAAGMEKAGGWIDGPNGEDLNDYDAKTFRTKLLVAPSEQLSVTAMLHYNETEQDYKSYSGEDRDTAQTVPSIAEQDYTLGTLDISYDFGAFTFLSSTGYLDQDGRSVDDSAQFYNDLFGAPLLATAITDSQGTLEKWSQEFRLTSNGEGRLRWLVGASYTDADNEGVITGDGESLVPGLPASFLGVVFLQDFSQTSEIWAVFGNASYDVTDTITIDLGGRYFSDKRSIDTVFELIDFPAPIPPSVIQDSETFTTFNPRLGVTFKTPNEGIVYVNAAKGFRSGGFNQVTSPDTPPTYDEETLWTYELGTKQTFADNRVFVEAAVYYNDYEDIQANQLVNPTVATVVNSGSASGPGADLAVRALLAESLMLSATLGWVDVEFDNDTVDKLEGDPLDMVPEWNGSLSLDWSPRLTDTMGLISRVDVLYTDEATLSLRSLQFTQIVDTESRTLVNLRLGLAFDQFNAYLYANNLFDEYKIVNPAFGAFFEPIYTRPRTIGLGLRGKF
jgi:outer membrane receptor protein involved in Fe transport